MANTRCGSLVVEQRELRSHWLQEKNEIESKMYQLQALQTQVQATMKKKEKEFEKLQGLLQKQIKDSMRGQKMGVVMSKPIPKNSSQVKSAPGAYLLRDAELAAVNGIVSDLTVITVFHGFCNCDSDTSNYVAILIRVNIFILVSLFHCLVAYFRLKMRHFVQLLTN